MQEQVSFYKVAVVNYFATGEGHSVFIVAGNDKTIEKEIDASFRKGMACMTPEAWLTENKKEEQSQFKHEIRTIKTFAPVLWSKIESLEVSPSRYFNFSMSYHANLL